MRFMSLALSSACIFVCVSAKACPLGPREDVLTVSRIMRNLGRYTMTPDQVIRDGRSQPDSVSDEQLKKAIQDVGTAQSCAQAVGTSNNPDLLPTKAGQLQGAERERYLASYYTQMADFGRALAEYQTLFGKVLQSEKSKRDFATLETKQKELRERANKAHGEL